MSSCRHDYEVVELHTRLKSVTSDHEYRPRVQTTSADHEQTTSAVRKREIALSSSLGQRLFA